jgi:hypothetical protein
VMRVSDMLLQRRKRREWDDLAAFHTLLTKHTLVDPNESM